MSTPDDNHRSLPQLICMGGLPATGKSAIGRRLANELAAAYVKIDTIEAAIGRAEGRFRNSNDWEQPPGYMVGYQLAADQLRIGIDVVAESVNPLNISRDAWRDAALAAGGTIVEVEVVCSDPIEHRRRAEGRGLDIPGWAKPTWEQITQREYDPWERNRLVVDTAVLSVEQAVQRVREAADR